MRAILTRIWGKRKAVLIYALLLLGGWLVGDALKELIVPEMRPMNAPMINRMIMAAFVAYVVLSAIPFVPGAEIGFALLLLFGGSVAPLVYLGMVCALLISYTIARLVPLPFLARALAWISFEKASRFVVELDAIAPDARLNMLSSIIPSKVGQLLLKHRFLLLAAALNTPGNSLLGGGGGLAFMAGASRLFGFWPFLAIVVFAVAPFPLIFFFA